MASFGDYLKERGPLDTGALLGDAGIVVCEPVPVPVSGILTCRRGQGSRTFQGKRPQTCDGIVKSDIGGQHKILGCEKCKLAHSTVEKDGILYYGALL